MFKNLHRISIPFTFALLTVLGLTILVFAAPANAQTSASSSDNENKKTPTPPGLYITPMALPHAVQQVLSPGFANYPNFVAGEAVKVAVSPDGNTLAILTAGMNSLYDSTGVVDQAASTQLQVPIRAALC